jgi:tetrapyrrole methylase family protein / MazG family protein
VASAGPGSRTEPPRIDVVGLGPAGPELVTAQARSLIAAADVVYLRTNRHPAAEDFPRARTFDRHYEHGDTFDEVYRAVVADLLDAARDGGAGFAVAYAVPGSPVVAERTVVLLLQHPDVVDGSVDVAVHPALSFLDLALTRLGVDPVEAGVTVVEAGSFASQAAGRSGPVLVAQCWSNAVLSDIKLSLDAPPCDDGSATAPSEVILLHHLGLPDEEICSIPWEDLDRTVAADHLTSLWIPNLAPPVGAEMIRLDELVHTLRLRCPWDRRQTHGSLARHLLEESYEVLEAIDTLSAIDAWSESEPTTFPAEDEERAVAHLQEELGDLLFQVYFHAVLAAEEGRFTLADVARGVHDKLVARHPHVFGDLTVTTPEEVASNWEALKLAEKNRSSVTEGIPAALPSLALTAKLQRKALAVGMELPAVAEDVATVTRGLSELADMTQAPRNDGDGGDGAVAKRLGDVLFALVNVARALGVEPETALRSRAASFRATVELRG